MITYISIGNTDDKLTQLEWSKFVADTRQVIDYTICGTGPEHPWGKVHGAWFSAPSDPWQNACWCVELDDGGPDFRRTPAEILKGRLAGVATEYRQNSIAWAVAPNTEFLSGGGEPS